jgi:hypothetical protein
VDTSALEPLSALLSSADPTHVTQGVPLVEALEDPSILDHLLGRSFLCAALRLQRSDPTKRWHGPFRGACPRGAIEDGPYTALVTLLLIALRVRARPEALSHQSWLRGIVIQSIEGPEHQAFWRWSLAESWPGLGPDFERELGRSPVFTTQEGVLEWLRGAGWDTAPITSERAQVERAAQVLLSDLTALYAHLASPLRDLVLSTLKPFAAPPIVSLAKTRLEALPDAVDLSTLQMLDLSDAAIRQLPPISTSGFYLRAERSALRSPPVGLRRLSLDAGQWRAWRGALRGLTELRIHGLEQASDLEGLDALPDLRSLGLVWSPGVVPPPLDASPTLRDALPRLRELAIECSPPGTTPAWLEPLHQLERLTLCGFTRSALPDCPPPALHSLVTDRALFEGLPEQWRAHVTFADQREVWLVQAGPARLKVMKAVRTARECSLREAKQLVDWAPRLVVVASGRAQALEVQARLEALGARAELR